MLKIHSYAYILVRQSLCLPSIDIPLHLMMFLKVHRKLSLKAAAKVESGKHP